MYKIENMHISVIVPLYNCEKYIIELYQRLKSTLSRITENFEIIFINDASPEKDWLCVKSLSQKDKRVKGLDLSRNFGQHQAIFAGLSMSKGEWVVVMDGDLQDLPEEIINLYDKTKEGYKVIFASRIIRQDSFLKRLGSIVFYMILSYLTDTNQDASIANFGIYHRKVIDTILRMEETTKYFPLFVKWTGYDSIKISVKHGRREGGRGSYSLGKLINLAFNVMISFSDKPLKLIIKTGFAISIVSFFYALWIVTKKYFAGNFLLGWPSLIASIWFLSGLIIFTMGITGLYIGRIYNEIKKRPLFIIKEKI